MPNRALKTNLDLIKFYYNQYSYFAKNKGKTTINGTKITDKLIQVTLKRMLELMGKEWKGMFDD